MTEKILITGSVGFLGKYVCETLRNLGYDYQTFDIADGQDITNPKHIAQALQNCTICIHLAAESDLYNALNNPEQCKQTNITGTEIISNLCTEYKIRLLYASTCCVYGNNGQMISNEQSSTMPTEIYAETKLQGEMVVQQSGCDYHILRLATFYGKGMRHSLAIHRFVKNNLLDKPIYIHGNGTQTRAYTHVQDIADAIALIVKSNNAPQCLNIAHAESHTVNDIIALIENITGKKSMIEYVADRQGQIFSSAIDSRKMQALGWQPQWNLQQGLENYIAMLKEPHHH